MRLKLIILLVAVSTLGATGLLFAAKYTTLIWEGESVGKLSGKSFVIKKYTDDPSGPVLSKKVLAVPKLPPGEKPKSDEVTYHVNVPADGVYYLWARTYWSTGCGNSFFVKVEGYNSGEWTIGGDGTYDCLHWVCLTDGGTNSSDPRPLRLKKGVVDISLGVRESGAMVDQFMLTTDRAKKPAGGYQATKDVLVLDN